VEYAEKLKPDDIELFPELKTLCAMVKGVERQQNEGVHQDFTQLPQGRDAMRRHRLKEAMRKSFNK